MSRHVAHLVRGLFGLLRGVRRVRDDALDGRLNDRQSVEGDAQAGLYAGFARSAALSQEACERQVHGAAKDAQVEEHINRQYGDGKRFGNLVNDRAQSELLARQCGVIGHQVLSCDPLDLTAGEIMAARMAGVEP